jgi:hypothetical protein
MDRIMKTPNSTRAGLKVIGPGEAPPGRFVTPADGAAPPRWEGEMIWATQHGPAQCAWRQGKPISVNNVLLPNGARGNAEYATFGAVKGWRRKIGKSDPVAEGWIFGTVEIADHDAVFVDDAVQPAPAQPVVWGYPDLECDLWASAELSEASRDRRFAVALCRVLERRPWRYAFGGLWQCTPRAAGAIVANLRARGENDRDYDQRDAQKPGGQKPGAQTAATDAHAAFFAQKIEAALSRIGWHGVPDPQFAALEASAVARIGEWEARPGRERPGWYLEDRVPQNAVAATQVGSLIQRIHALAASDRLSQEEWRSLFALLHGEG